jgi:hypothetical protein
MRIHPVQAAVASLVLASCCAAQVSFEWSGEFAPPGAPGRVLVSGTHDFGAGPRPVIVAETPGSRILVLHLDEFGWQPLGPALEGGITSLCTYDSGSGPELHASGSMVGSSASLGPVFKWTGTQWTSLAFPGGSVVDGLTTFDFGSGPRLCLYRSSGGSGGLWTWDGASWATIPGSDVAPPDAASDFATFDDGAGPRLFAAGGSQVRKWTGTTWQVVGTANDSVTSLTVFDDGAGAKLHAGGKFTLIGGVAANIVARWNGSTWSAVGPGLTFPAFATAAVVTDLAVVQGAQPLLYAAGAFSHAGATFVGPIATWDGTSWSATGASYVTSDVFTLVRTLTAAGPPGGQTVYAGGNFLTIDATPVWYVAARVGNGAWQQAPAGNGAAPASAIIYATAVFDSGNGPELYAAGGFGSIGGVAVNGVARFDGTSWNTVGPAGVTGSGGGVRCFAVWNDGTGDALYAGGGFNSIGGVPCNNVAKWNGTTWSPLGSGVASVSNPAVQALLALPGPYPGLPSYLIAGGLFIQAGGVGAQGIAAWDGASWSSMGSTIGAALSLALFDDGAGARIYAGGVRSAVAAPPLSEFQRFDPPSWVSVPGWSTPSPSNSIPALRTFDDGSGTALYLSSSTGPQLRKFDGTAVTSVGTTAASGFFSNPTIRTLSTFDDGGGLGLCLGGGFTSVDGIPAAGVAQYRGGVFSALGAGLGPIDLPFSGGYTPPIVWTSVAHDDGSGPSLFAGGSFTKAGSHAAGLIARWGAADPILSLTQPGGPGAPLFVASTNLQAGREYLHVASLEVCSNGPGTGPYLGLCASDPATLLAQAMLPLGTIPFHFLAPGASVNFGPYGLPGGLMIEGITIDVTSGQVWRVSPVASITTQ